MSDDQKITLYIQTGAGRPKPLEFSASMSVADIRSALGLAAHYSAALEGEPVPADTRPKGGQTLNFTENAKAGFLVQASIEFGRVFGL